MKFIFPKNYKYKNKIFGMFDYSTAIINLIFYIVVYFFINFFFHKSTIKNFFIYFNLFSVFFT